MKRTKAQEQNPFLTPAPAPTPLRPAEDGQDFGPVAATGAPIPTGAPAPQHPPLHLPPWSYDRRYPAPRLTQLPRLQVAGLHGGAGTSTVTAMLGPGVIDCGRDLVWLLSLKVPVLLVARTHGHGLDLVRRAGQQWAASSLQPLQILGLMLVSDAPDLGDLSRPVASVSRIFPRTWRLDWSEELRQTTVLPQPDQLTGRLGRIRKDVLNHAGKVLERTNFYPNTVRRTS